MTELTLVDQIAKQLCNKQEPLDINAYTDVINSLKNSIQCQLPEE